MYLVIFCYWVGPVPYLELFGAGPAEKNTLYHCDSIVQEALESYLSDCKREGDKEGRFIRRSSKVKTWLVSKAVDSKLNCPPKLLVMSQDK